MADFITLGKGQKTPLDEKTGEIEIYNKYAAEPISAGREECIRYAVAVAYLALIEEALSDDDECCCCCDDDDDDDEEEEPVFYEVTCPSCGKTITVDEDVLFYDSIECPSCGEKLEFEFDEDDGDEDDDEEDDDE